MFRRSAASRPKGSLAEHQRRGFGKEHSEARRRPGRGRRRARLRGSKTAAGAQQAEPPAQAAEAVGPVNLAEYRRETGSQKVESYGFSTPTGNIECDYQGPKFGCFVKQHAPWPRDRYDNGGNSYLNDKEPNVVGWMFDDNGTRRTRTWVQQENWPHDDSVPYKQLPYGATIEIPSQDNDPTKAVRCHSDREGLTCNHNSAQFFVSNTVLDTPK